MSGALLTLSGGAAAGKTTIAAALVTAARGHEIAVLHGDDYYVTERDRGVWLADSHVSGGGWYLDVGDPRSVDWTRLTGDVTEAMASAAVVIVEGMFARRTEPPGEYRRFDVFVDVPADLRLARKIQRQCVVGDLPVGILIANYLNHRRFAHARHVEPARERCDLVVDGEQAPEVTAEQIWLAGKLI